MLTLIKGPRIYTPQDEGYGDILIAGGKILAINKQIDPPAGIKTVQVDGQNLIATPGFIDLHMHLIGGGGEGGPATRMPEIPFNDIVGSGVTTAVGLLGTDNISKTPDSLLHRVLGLRQKGISAYMFSGAYDIDPLVTVTGSLKKDIALIEPVIGVGEVAISDHRSCHPTFEELARAAAHARVGGMLGKKPGLVHLHPGSGERGLDLLFRLVNETDIPISQFLPTHVTRTKVLFAQALELARLGGNIDITLGVENHQVSTADALRQLEK